MRMPHQGCYGNQTKAVIALSDAMITATVRAQIAPWRRASPARNRIMPMRRWIQPHADVSNLKT